MFHFTLNSLRSSSRRRRQVGRSIACPAQILENKQLLSGAQPQVNSIQPEATGSGEEAKSEPPVTTTNPAFSRILSASVTGYPLRSASAMGLRASVPVTSPLKGLTAISTPAASPISNAALSRVPTYSHPTSTLAAGSRFPIRPSIPGFTGISRLRDDHGSTMATATDIDSPSTTKGSLHYRDSDWFRLEVEKGKSYTINTELLTLQDSTLRIRDAQGRSVAFDNSGNGLASRLTWRATEDSTIFIEVRAHRSYQTGTYRLHVSHDSSEGDQTHSTPDTNPPRTFWRTTRIYIRRIIWF